MLVTRRTVQVFTLGLLLAAAVSPLGSQQAGDDTALLRMRAAIVALMSHYNPARGLFQTEGWWNAANSITEIGNADAINPLPEYAKIFDNTFNKAPAGHPLFRNNAYDDEGWWGLAWVQAYDVTHKDAYLTMAESIFDDMTGGWDNTCGGGLWWMKDRRYKNAIANELYLSLGAHLAARTEGKKHDMYLDAAKREWAWFAASGMINSNHLVNDGLTASCKNNHQTTWSYNQGVILGGLAELARVTGDHALLDQANVIAHAAIVKLSDANGILHDPKEPDCGPNAIQFKGIFIRNLAALNHDAPDEAYAKTIRTNAEAVWTEARTPSNKFACRWSGPPEGANAGTTTSALGALVAAAGLK